MLERIHSERGVRHIFGLDEAGRGPMAGPLVAAAVCLPLHNLDSLHDTLRGVKDSKQMTIRQRENAAEQIKEVALAWGIGEVAAQEMPAVGNMTAVTLLAMQRALQAAASAQPTIEPELLLIDYYRLPAYDHITQESLTRGENRSLSIAAASVLAKVDRDQKMCDFAAQYPEYGFAKHKGYPTKAHRDALQKHGACAIHRRNYRPVQLALGLTE